MKTLEALRKVYGNVMTKVPSELRQQVEFEIVKVANEVTLQEEIATCAACFLAETCTKKVPGKGLVPADIMFVSEYPSEVEDLAGEPFMGPSGDMLDAILKAIGWEREDIYITNVLKCKPPKGHTPHKAEIAQCRKHLMKEIELVQPKVILCWGSLSANTLIHPDFKMTQEVGHWFEDDGRRLMAVYNPAYVMRQPEGSAKQDQIKWEIWNALQKVEAFKNAGYPADQL